ncbi:hypothetical protein B0H15DRAFT_801419 [Mycena belliarum]|uniref:Uncharacterized protein n=1 Tax=Mycena belliarum TaxID=1033014 RepID=A0AAD6U6L8_9AGAR|nr:hypothetical protein B0H15DRAFT_801419 [Mycena belliae]
MSTPLDSISTAANSENWRATPPHMDAGPVTSAQSASARTQSHLQASGARTTLRPDHDHPAPPVSAATMYASAQSRVPQASPRTTYGTLPRDQDGTPKVPSPSPVSSGSPRPGTTSPTAPTGLTARVVMDDNGKYYLIQPRRD